MPPVPIYLALGSNLGDRRAHLLDAIDQLRQNVHVARISSMYETEPAYVTDQPRFLNLALHGSTELAPDDLLRFVKGIEQRMGRAFGPRYGPRPIDIDILAYDDRRVEQPDLTIPHPLIAERAFVLEPLAEIAPDLVLPGYDEPVETLAQRLGHAGIVRVIPSHAEQEKYIMPRSTELVIGPATFHWGRQTYLMGILNVTPDSFSGDGVLASDDWITAAVARAVAQVEAGADILDIGGESTRPGSQPVPLNEELRRVVPVIRALADVMQVPISIDTYKAEVARQAVAAGATIINDVWGLRMDAGMARVVAESGVAVVLMHNRIRPGEAIQQVAVGNQYIGLDYGDLMADIMRELQESIDLALAAGVAPERIIVDPGIGFGKNAELNYVLVDRLDELQALGYPILVGPSRKGFTGRALQLPPDQRVEGTAAAMALLIDRGADIVRVHDVASMKRVARITDLIVRRGA